jgi:hypothetical protein
MECAVLTCRPPNPPKEPIRPMTLGSMRRLGVRSLAVSCHQCHHETIINADRWPGQMRVPSFGPRMVCTKCGAVGADIRPNWRERQPLLALIASHDPTIKNENAERRGCHNQRDGDDLLWVSPV